MYLIFTQNFRKNYKVLLNHQHNIIIVGSGIVGMTLALSLSKKKKCKVTILEKNSKSDFLKYKGFKNVCHISRVSRILTNIDVWDKIN